MSLFVISEGAASYNDDVQPNVTEEQFNEFEAAMKSGKPFDLDNNNNQTLQDTEKTVKEAEKKNDSLL